MAVNTVRVQVNGAWVTLTKNGTTGKYEGTVSAPAITSYNVNANHYYPVTVEATDQAGNKTTATDAHATLGSSLKLAVKETTAPAILITAPSAGTYLATNTPTISVQLRDEANGSGVKISTFYLIMDGNIVLTNVSPGVTVTAVTNGYDITYIPPTALSDGSHTVEAEVSDNDGNTMIIGGRNFIVDTVPPVLNVTIPSAATSYQNILALSVAGVTNDATSSSVVVRVKLNSGSADAVTTDAGGNFTKALTLVVGTNTITVTSTDLAGKVSTVVRTVVVDMTPPVISDITITPNPVNVNSSYVVSVTVAD